MLKKLFRLLKVRAGILRNHSVAKNYLRTMNGTIPFEENTPLRLMKFFA